MSQVESDWVNIGTYETIDAARERAMVPLSMGQAVRLENSIQPGHIDLQTETAVSAQVHHELQEYEAEQASQQRETETKLTNRSHAAGIHFITVWIFAVNFAYYQQLQHTEMTDRFISSSIGLIRDGEWWRPFTALFLHGDGGHLFGNLVSGTVFFALVGKVIGAIRGWLLILLAGTLGNALTSLITYPTPFYSLGASTAVFAALGILSGTGLLENMQQKARPSWVRIFMPVIAGIVLLGWLGGGSVNGKTDVFGHVFGFLMGCVLGFLCKFLEDKKQLGFVSTLNQH